MSKYFGTDGIRGLYGETLTDNLAYLTGNAIAALKPGVKVIIGRDTRVSGENLANSLIKGVLHGGGSVTDAGIIPTPTIAFSTISTGADYGVVISASHNPPGYNGIKLFNSLGRKIPDSDKEFIEQRLSDNTATKGTSEGELIDGAALSGAYIDKVVGQIGISFKGYSVALDCADGASYKTAPEIFRRLGATVYSYSDLGDGSVININKGALHPAVIAGHTTGSKCDIGFAFDGDADRMIACDSSGRIIDGDLVVYAVANYLKKRGRLKGDTAVGTHHTNMGMEQALLEKGIKLIRTKIGDQYVADEMIRNDYIIGGEQSGHIIMREFLETGDGIFAAALLMKIMVEEKQPINNLVNVNLMPQINSNIIVKDNVAAINDPGFQAACREAEARINGKGRLLVRASGTEPKVRLMVESPDLLLAKSIVANLERVLKGNA
ncbi:MAG: phosphoglucosamine mutase [Christensenellales bacterium]|jgi:phosphoglucosamine mutase